jgi:hypothetical protein
MKLLAGRFFGGTIRKRLHDDSARLKAELEAGERKV